MKHRNERIQALLDILPKLSQQQSVAAIDLSFERIEKLLAELGNPHLKLASVVHVAGTNGKGSLLAYLTSILQAAGYRVHRYTSPHLVYFNERIMLAGCEISDEQLIAVLKRIARLAEIHPVTFFEATTAAAFLAFAETPADIVLLETGLGGRLDATNLVPAPLLTAITPVSIDHKEYLGDTLAKIAAEKAGIIKVNTPCVLGPQVPEAAEVLAQVAIARNAPLFRFAEEWSVQAEQGGFRYRSAKQDTHFPLPNLYGEHQLANAGTAIACAEQLAGFRVSKEHIIEGITHAVWPARLQHLAQGKLAELLPSGGELWLDGGHNPGAGEVLGQWVRMQKKPVHIICGMLANKDTAEFLAPLAPHIRSLTAVAIEDEPLGQDPEMIAAVARSLGVKRVKTAVNHNIKNAIESIVSEKESEFSILMCGSLYLAGNILWQNGWGG